MTHSSRKPFVGGNWKCNGTHTSIDALVAKLNQVKPPPSVETVVAPTFLHLERVQNALDPSYHIAAQNVSSLGLGAFTGEVSVEQLVDAKIQWVILGHSERRQIFHADDASIMKQVLVSLKHGMSVIACVGETLAERKANHTWTVIERQLNSLAAGIKANEWSRLVIAYEPVWAIGTGETASPAQAQEVHAQIRAWLIRAVSAPVSEATRIIYGGSVKGSNAEELFAQRDIDGFLVGGASLQAEDFIKIFQAPTKVKSKI